MSLRRFLEASMERVVGFRDAVGEAHITPSVSAATVRKHLEATFGSFEGGWKIEPLVDEVGSMLEQWNVHVTHPRYFGLFNPQVVPAAVAADLLVAGFNPQLAAWSHAPAANEIEAYVLSYLAGRLGLDPANTAATFTNAGAEANQSAVVVALTHHLPDYLESGLLGASARPTIYVTGESHHSIAKAAHLTGIGRGAVRKVPTDGNLKMSIEGLELAIEKDRQQGLLPFMAVATAGTTGGGIIDPLDEVGSICERQGLWFHVDAAWGGAACLSPRLAPALGGIERADSVTWDAHKWLSVPMAAGMFFCAHPQSVRRAFAFETAYMPDDVDDTIDPYAATVQWSRRHIGLKLFMSLAWLGADGYRQAIEHQADMGELLESELRSRGWRIVNDSPFPVTCFTRPELDNRDSAAETLARRLEEENFWVSPVRLGGGAPVLRACITSYETKADDVVALAHAATQLVENDETLASS